MVWKLCSIYRQKLEEIKEIFIKYTNKNNKL